jgi:arylsulfotransferase ASST
MENVMSQPVDVQTRRRTTRTGLTAFDESRACPGYVLFAPITSSGEVFLINLRGQIAHRWQLPYSPGLWGYLLPNGNLFYLGHLPDPAWKQLPFEPRFMGGILLEVDWNGNIVWEHRDPFHHHDARRTSSGGAVYLAMEQVPSELVTKVQGGIPGTDERGMWADVIVEIDASGRRIWEWHAYEHLSPTADIITSNDPRVEWSHANTVVPLDGDRILLSCRNISTIGIIDKSTGMFTWKLGYDVLAQQHDPSLLNNGNILVFDNGVNPKSRIGGFSRVIEIEPANHQIVWEYRDTPVFNFFSPYISGARRLPNGNTLVTEGLFGRMFQVTPDKQVVWEYINPRFYADSDGVLSNRVFRASHYLPEDIPRLHQPETSI